MSGANTTADRNTVYKVKTRAQSFALIVIGLLLTSCAKPPPETIVLAEASQPVFALVYIAEKLGYFAEEELAVSYRSFTSGRDALQSVVDGESDLATSYETPVVLQAFGGQVLSVVSSLHYSTRNTALVANRQHGINGPTDLVGKTVGVSKNTNGEFFLSLYLRSNGVDSSQVKIIDVNPQNMGTALAEGKVDAVATWNPNLWVARHALPENDTLTLFSDVYSELSVLVGKRSFVAQHPERITKMLKALLRAKNFLETHPDEALKLVITRLPNQSEQIVRDTWQDSQKRIALNNVMLSVFQQEADWFLASGRFDKEKPDFNTIIEKKFLESLAPELVTLH